MKQIMGTIKQKLRILFYGRYECKHYIDRTHLNEVMDADVSALEGESGKQEAANAR